MRKRPRCMKNIVNWRCKKNHVPERDWAIPVAFHNSKMYMGVPNILALAKELTPE